MARGFDMTLKLSVSDAAVAAAALKAAKDPKYCHTLLLAHLIVAQTATAQELVDWLSGSLDQMTEAGAAQWKKYSAGCHMAYFLNRYRGAVVGTQADGTVVVGKARAKKAKAEAPAEAPAEAQPAEAVEA